VKAYRKIDLGRHERHDQGGPPALSDRTMLLMGLPPILAVLETVRV
jgi:hypothetical protein